MRQSESREDRSPAPAESRGEGVRAYRIDRREAIQRVTAVLGGIALVGGSRLLEASERIRPALREVVTQQGVGSFTAQDVALLDEVADTILPETNTPGAKAARTGAFMALMVTDTYTQPEREVFREGLGKLWAAGFLALTPAQRLAMVEQLDREQHAHMEARTGGDTPRHYFRMMKELALFGYFTSEIGYTQAQRYVEAPGRFDPCVPYTPGERSWAPHA